MTDRFLADGAHVHIGCPSTTELCSCEKPARVVDQPSLWEVTMECRTPGTVQWLHVVGTQRAWTRAQAIERFRQAHAQRWELGACDSIERIG